MKWVGIGLALLPVMSGILIAAPGSPETAGKRRWIALYSPPFREALKPLAERRNRAGYEVEEIAATAESLPQIADLKKSPRPGDCVVIVGALEMNTGQPKDCVLDFWKGSRGRMAGRLADNRLGLDASTGLPLLTVGRLPASSPDELATMIGKIAAYEDQGAISNGRILCITGNPMPGNDESTIANGFIIAESKEMQAKLDPAWQLTGVADVTGHPFAGRHKDFRTRVTESLQQPWEVLAVFGHSGPDGLWSKDAFSLTEADWKRLTSPGRRGIFFCCGCFGMARQSAYEVAAVRSPGGPVAAIGASGESWSAMGFLAGNGLTACLAKAGGPPTVGEWWRRVQAGLATGVISPLKFVAFDQVDGTRGKVSLKDQRLEHLEMWSLLGDPATVMPEAP